MIKDGRRDKRIPIGLKIRFKSATISDFIEQYSRDISKGGIFIRMKSPMPVGTLIKFDFRLHDEKSLIQGVGRVVWRREEDAGEDAPAGMGIKFIKLDDASRENLETILEGQPSGPSTAAEEPAVEEVDADEEMKPPEPIAPVRPVAVPRSAKRTMMGMGPSAGTSAPPRPSTEEPSAEPAPDTDESVATAKEAAADSAGTSENELLADISSAIDTALGTGGSIDEEPAEEEAEEPAEAKAEEPAEAKAEEPVEEKAEEPAEAKAEEPAEEKAEEPVEEKAEESVEAEAEEPAEAKAEEPAEDRAEEEKRKAEEKKKKAEEKTPSEPPPVAPKKDDEKKGVPGIVWFLLLVVAGAAVWFLFFRESDGEPDESVPKKVGTARSEQPKTAEPKPAEPPEPALKAPEPTEPEPVAASPAAAVTVTTKPEGAKVFVDGSEQDGLTPLELKDLPMGKEIEIHAKLFGRVAEPQKVIPGEEPLKVEFALKQTKVEVEVISDPPGAQVMVDGKWFAKAPRTVARKGLGPKFEYTMIKKGFEDFLGSVTESDWSEQDGVFKVTINAVLKPVEKKVAPPPKPKEDKPKPKPKEDKPKPKPKEDKPKPKPKPAIEDDPYG